MPWDAISFKAAYPEFDTAPDALVMNALEDAAALTESARWGTLADQGIALRAAQSLALSPFGRGMKLVQKDGSTVYDARLNRLIAIMASGGQVI